MRSIVLASLLCLAAATPALAQSDEAVAMRFYPDELRADALRTQPDPVPPQVAFVRGDLTGKGSSFLVAAYSNGRIGALRVIDVSGTPRLAGEDLDLWGHAPEVELFDLDRDGRPEIIAVLAAMRTGFTSIYKWAGARLDLWGPSKTNHRGIERTILPSIGYADIDGDGLLELIEETDPEDGRLTGRVYRLRGGRYVQAGTAVFHASYRRGTGEPETVRTAFRAPAGAWTLRVVGGHAAGEIRLNGALLGRGERMSVPVTLRGENTLEIELRGEPGSGPTIVIAKP